VHVLDCATLEPGRDPLSDLDTIETELAAYSADLDEHWGRTPMAERPRVVVLNKVDVPEALELAELVRDDLQERGLPVFEVSAVARTGLRELSFALADYVAQARADEPDPVSTHVVLRPTPVDDQGFTVTRREQGTLMWFQVRGDRPERWVRQTDFANDEAVGYLADRLARLGVEGALVAAGAVAGDEVRIGPDHDAVVFDWEPTLVTGAERLGGPRGTDPRLDDRHRPTRDDRRRAHHERMDAKAAARAQLATERDLGVWTDPDGR
jgi:GTP-binding protein